MLRLFWKRAKLLEQNTTWGCMRYKIIREKLASRWHQTTRILNRLQERSSN